MDNLHGGNLVYLAKKYRLDQDNIIDFSSNINPLGVQDAIKELIEDNMHLITRYPDPESSRLRSVLLDSLNQNEQYIGENNIIFGNGSDELFFILARLYPDKKALIPVPSYSDYEKAAFSAGMDCRFLKNPEKDSFWLNVDGIVRELPDMDMVFIGNPNNPTSVVEDPDKIGYILKKCNEYRVLMVIDEAFIDFCPDYNSLTFIQKASYNPDLAVIRSLTKIFAIPGLRLGYMIACQDLVDRLNKIIQSWPLNCFAQLVGERVVKDSEYIRKTRAYVSKEKDILFNELDRIKWLSPYRPDVNFILCRIIAENVTAEDVNRHCASHSGILIRDCVNFRGLDNSFIRIAVKSKKENSILIRCLNEAPF